MTSQPQRILLVTGMSGAGKSTTLRTLEDLGWETVDNLPLSLLDALLATREPVGAQQARPIAFGIDSRTRGFDGPAIIERLKTVKNTHPQPVEMLFLDCSGAELERRFSETRRRHPLAPDRPASDGIAREREMVAGLRRWADQVIDTSATNAHDLQVELRNRFADASGASTTVSIMSFGFARGIPRNADLVFDMRFLRNPHWVPELRPETGLDSEVADYVMADPAYEAAVSRITELLLLLLPRYSAEGKAYLTVAFGCTGGRHRSVCVAENVARSLKESGLMLTVSHRDIAAASHVDILATKGEDAGEIVESQ
jgi:RNase adapter protein RapZ